MESQTRNKPAVSFRLAPAAIERLERFAAEDETTKTATLEKLLKEEEQRRGRRK